jgi:hypothetical protein
MVKRWKVECDMCGEKNSFADIQEINLSNWKVIAWIVPIGDPRVICNKCEYGKTCKTIVKPKKKSKSKK